MIDKIEHFLVTFCITVFMGYFSIVVGIVMALVFSFSKEIYDNKIKKEDVEISDLSVDFMGILLGIFVLVVF